MKGMYSTSSQTEELDTFFISVDSFTNLFTVQIPHLQGTKQKNQ